MYIQHEPTYKIIIMFADKSDRKTFLESIDPKLRRYVQLKNARKSRNLATRELDEINTALKSLAVPYRALYDLKTERFEVIVENQADVAKVEQLLPATRKVETTVTIGPVPKIQAAPTNVQAGDSAFGGNPVFATATGTASYCSLGFAVNYSVSGVAKKGILTSGHCPNTMYLDYAGRRVTLSGPVIDKPARSGNGDTDGVNDKYDYQIFDMTGITVSSTIKYKDINGIPEFPATGSLKLTGVTDIINQKAGMVVCKSGHSTGITCGKITNGNATRDGVAGWIEVSQTQQGDISAPGDSGSPWFLYPGTSSSMTGVGVHTAGAGTGTTSIAQYMPIDYINDHNTTVATIKN